MKWVPGPASGITSSPVNLADGEHRLRGIEVEVAYRMAQSLPARSEPYSAEEVAEAVDAAIAVVEVVETRLSDRGAADGLWALADNQSHDGLILSVPVSDWRALSLASPHVRLSFDDDVVVDRACKNAGGHPFDVVVRFANLCGSHCGGLQQGQIVTTGSLMGVLWAPPGATVNAEVEGLGRLNVNFDS